MKTTIPVINEGATMSYGSDSYAYRVIEVSKDNKSCVIARIDARRIDTNGVSELQEYDYSNIINNSFIKLVFKHNKWKREQLEIHLTDKLKEMVNSDQEEWWNSEEYKKVYPGNSTVPVLIEGLTKQVKCYYPVKITFGVAREYQDPCF